MRATTSRMRLLAAATAVGCVLALCWGMGTAEAQRGKKKGKDPDGKNDLGARARWNWRLVDAQDKDLQTGTFMGYRSGEIKQGKPQELIGTFTVPSPGELRATFTGGPLKGEAVLSLTKRKPVIYRGQLTRPDGSKARLVLRIIND